MTFLKAEQQQKFGKLRLLAAEPAAGGGCLFNFCSFVTRELNFCELRIIAVTSLGHQKPEAGHPGLDTITVLATGQAPASLPLCPDSGCRWQDGTTSPPQNTL